MMSDAFRSCWTNPCDALRSVSTPLTAPPPSFDGRSRPAPLPEPEEDPLANFIARQLAEQRGLRPVEKAARLHETQTAPALESHYRDLIPLSSPAPGEQYAFEVDLDRCSGCKGCVTACHSLNGLDDGESWRSVGLLLGRSQAHHPPPDVPRDRFIPLQQTVTTACHHCVEPACLHGCPVLAYDKDPVTGIVRHLDDQCIGCSYCVLKCPYEVPKYSSRLGIVRKCDLCHGRLAAGEAPACVQACPNEAIRVTLVESRQVRTSFETVAASATWLPDSPSPSITLPTTRYISRQANGALVAADHHLVEPAPAHGPLVWMLALTQAGLGGLTAAAWMSVRALPTASTTRVHGLVATALALLFTGLIASVFHLGRPAKAWKVWLGWRRSWLSREALILNAATGLSVASAGQMLFLQPTGTTMPSVLTFVSLASVSAQIMVYVDTGRRFWRLASTAPRFLGTFGVACATSIAIADPGAIPALVLILVIGLKLAMEATALVPRPRDSGPLDELSRTARLLRGTLRPCWVLRITLASAGVLLTAIAPIAPRFGIPALILAAACILAGELMERLLFFTAVSPNRMPGFPR